MKRSLLFVHLPKTGGASLTGAVSNRFAARECLLLYGPDQSLEDLDSRRYVSGHVPLSFAERLAEPPFVFTILRDPIERSLSAYSFYRTRPPEFAGKVVLRERPPEAYERMRQCLRLCRECTLEELIERAPEIAIEYFGNRQARLLASSDPEGGDETLEAARDALDRCDFVGLSDRLEESALRLTRRLGWTPLAPLPRVNVTPQRLGGDELSRRGLQALEELTSIDRELYRQAEERYEREPAEPDARAAIEDAKPVRDLGFDGPIPGAGWIGREQVAGVCFCWMAKSAWVELAPDPEASTLVVEIAHSLHQSILAGLRLSIDGVPVNHTLAGSVGGVVATARPPASVLQQRDRLRVGVDVDRTLRPCDVDPASNDDRVLSVAISRIALERG